MRINQFRIYNKHFNLNIMFYSLNYFKNYKLIEDNLLSSAPIEISKNAFYHLMP